MPAASFPLIETGRASPVGVGVNSALQWRLGSSTSVEACPVFSGETAMEAAWINAIDSTRRDQMPRPRHIRPKAGGVKGGARGSNRGYSAL